jgi:predicted metal-dependent phosphoesterase TrpH
VIDLHTHTTASDGRCSAAELVARAAAAGVTVLSVTDHDTVAACAAADAACRAAGIEFVPGIEVTAVEDDADVHVLGYFVDPESAPLRAFLTTQRQNRIDRVRLMIAKLAESGVPLDADAILAPALADSSKSVGRPWIARALVAAGHVTSTNEAFELWLARGRPAFVARDGAPPEQVIARIHEAGGIASLAHPGLLRRDTWIAGFIDAGLDALEAHHSEHDPAATAHYRQMAEQFSAAITGGSDYHADESHGALHPGSTALPHEDFERLKVRLKPGTPFPGVTRLLRP